MKKNNLKHRDVNWLYFKSIFKELRHVLTLQLNGIEKARVLDLENSYKKVGLGPTAEPIRSQYAIYDYLKNKLHENG